MPISEFTKLLRARGWTIAEACERWGIRVDTYYARVRNPKMHSQLLDMCNGLPDKLEITK